MHIECALTDFREAVEWAKQSLDVRPVSMGASGIKLVIAANDPTTLDVSAVGADTSSRSAIPVTADGPVEIVIQGRLLADIVKTSKGDTITLSDDTRDGVLRRVQVVIGRTQYGIPVLPVDSTPPSPQHPTPFGSVNGKDFAEAVRRAATAAATDGTALPVLTALQVTADPNTKLMTLAATDRFRLAVATLPYSPTDEATELVQFLVSGKHLLGMAKLYSDAEQVEWAVAGTAAAGVYGTTSGNRASTGRLLGGEFPQWNRLLPAESDISAVAVIDTAEFADCLKRVALVAEGTPTVQLALSEGAVTVTAGAGGTASAEDYVAAEYNGEPFEASYNASYLAAALAVAGSSKVVFQAIAARKPALISASADGKIDPRYRYLVMPLRS